MIGGGVIGTACAYFLMRAGWQVTLVDRGHDRQRQLARQLRARLPEPCPARWPSRGWSRKGIKSLFRRNSPFAIKPRLDPALWSWLLHFAARCNERDMIEAGRGIQPLLLSSLALYRELIERESLDCEFESRGLLFAYRSKQEMEAYAATDRLMSEAFHCPARRLRRRCRCSSSSRRFEPGLAGGWYYHDDAHLRPDKLMQAWRRVARSRRR